MIRRIAILSGTVALLATVTLAQTELRPAQPVWDEYPVGGLMFQRCQYKGVEVLVYMHKHPFGATVYLANHRDSALIFNPAGITAEAVGDRRNPEARTAMVVYSPDEVMRKTRRNERLKAGIAGAAAGWNSVPRPTVSTTSGETSGTYSRQDGASGTYSGTYSGTTVTTPSAADRAAAQAELRAETERLHALAEERTKVKAASLLVPAVVEPGAWHAGIMHMKVVKANVYHVTIPFGGENFRFRFRSSQSAQAANQR